MKQLTPELAAHLATGATTLAHVWLVIRADGLRLGLTDHDRPLTVDGVPCSPADGGETSTDVSGPGLAQGGAEVNGALTLDGLSERDLEMGLWDGAEVSVHRVNWADPTQSLLLRRARIGEVSRSGSAFSAELRSLSHQLEVARGRVFSATCDANLGDARCTVDLSDPAYSAAVTISEAVGLAEIAVSGLESFEADWFSGGLLEVLDGDFAGFTTEIASHIVSRLSSRVHLKFWQAPPAVLGAGTGLRLTAGCDRRFQTCSGKFNNTLNFQGFPHMPGNDFVLSYPNRNSGENDGGMLKS